MDFTRKLFGRPICTYNKKRFFIVKYIVWPFGRYFKYCKILKTITYII